MRKEEGGMRKGREESKGNKGEEKETSGDDMKGDKRREITPKTKQEKRDEMRGKERKKDTKKKRGEMTRRKGERGGIQQRQGIRKRRRRREELNIIAEETKGE